MIELQNIVSGYSGKKQIGPINIKFEENELTVLIGPNGCGKSTLLKTIARHIKPFDGKILIENIDSETMPSKAFARKVAYLSQNRLVSGIQVKTLVLHGRFPYLGYPRKYRAQDIEIAQDCMKTIGISHLANKSMSNLSGGERQKVCLAMLLAQGGDIVIMDEPTTFLDIKYQIEVMKLISNLRDMGKTLIVVLHDINMAMRYADKVVVMDKGNILQMGKPDSVYQSGILENVFQVKSGYYDTVADGMQYYFV